MARGDFERGKDHSISHRAILKIKDFQKLFLKKTSVLSQQKMENPPRPKIKFWVNPNKILVIKEKF